MIPFVVFGVSILLAAFSEEGGGGSPPPKKTTPWFRFLGTAGSDASRVFVEVDVSSRGTCVRREISFRIGEDDLVRLTGSDTYRDIRVRSVEGERGDRVLVVSTGVEEGVRIRLGDALGFAPGTPLPLLGIPPEVEDEAAYDARHPAWRIGEDLREGLRERVATLPRPPRPSVGARPLGHDRLILLRFDGLGKEPDLPIVTIHRTSTTGKWARFQVLDGPISTAFIGRNGPGRLTTAIADAIVARWPELAKEPFARSAGMNPIYVACHTCHAQALEPCRWGRDPHHDVRERAAKAYVEGRLPGWRTVVDHALAHGDVCVPDGGGICGACGRNVENLKRLARRVRHVPGTPEDG